MSSGEADAIRFVDHRLDLAAKIRAQNPDMSEITAFIIAGDMDSVSLADQALAEGDGIWAASVLVGSYARLDWIVRQLEAGRVPREEVLDHLPDVWRGSDPDDTDARFFLLWREAWARNGRRTIYDGDPLPAGRVLKIYRGQHGTANSGIAWTLDEKIAQRFAITGGGRGPMKVGVVHTAFVQRRDVIAYLTLRREQEVVVNPMTLFGAS